MSQKEERFYELWTDFLEGDLDEAGMAELRSLMAEDESLLTSATDIYQLHRLLGVLTSESAAEADSFVRDTMDQLPQDSEQITGNVMTRLRNQFPERMRYSESGRLLLHYGGWAMAALLMLLLVFWHPLSPSDSPTESRVQFASLAKASFFGELTPPVKSKTELNRNYSLVSGSVELTFPSGAQTIIEGPAIFRVASNDRLELDVGQCSVYAPKGAEGFRVDTPTSRVVDRGTRFFVSVSELTDTEVQVIEGAADVYPTGDDDELEALKKGEALRIGNSGPVPANFSDELYAKGVPDRIVSYEAELDENGRAERLSGLTVQRDGREIHYSANDLIPIELTSFNAANDPGPYSHIISGGSVPARRASLLEDLALNTGIINPGGSLTPLSGPFDPEATPGFRIRFARPVTNGPGPDIVLFELQNPSYPPEGDAFHVSPLSWGDGQRSFTVDRYDLMLTSAEALPVSSFHHFVTKGTQITSLEELENAEGASSKPILSFNALAAGIDLSDLGFQEGAQVDELFFQDAMGDLHLFDPVLIMGLPE